MDTVSGLVFSSSLSSSSSSSSSSPIAMAIDSTSAVVGSEFSDIESSTLSSHENN